MIQGYLLSLLAKQRALLQNRFDARYPHAWIVWEPGTRFKPQTPDELEAGKTRLPTRDRLHPTADDALCFPMPIPTKEGNCLTLGRQLDSSITIDDMSVSREHVRLHWRHERWQLEPVGYATALVEGVPVHGGRLVPLTNGTTILLGGVILTFYERHRFIDRLMLEEKKNLLDQLR